MKLSRHKSTKQLVTLFIFIPVILLTVAALTQPQRIQQFAQTASQSGYTIPPLFGCLQVGEGTNKSCSSKLGVTKNYEFTLHGRPLEEKQVVYYGDRLWGSFDFENVGDLDIEVKSIGFGGESKDKKRTIDFTPKQGAKTLKPDESVVIKYANYKFKTADPIGEWTVGPRLLGPDGKIPVDQEELTITVNSTCTALRTQDLTETDRKNIQAICAKDSKNKLCESKQYCEIFKGGNCPQPNVSKEIPLQQCDQWIILPQEEQDILEVLCAANPDTDMCKRFCERSIESKLCPKRTILVDAVTGKPITRDDSQSSQAVAGTKIAVVGKAFAQNCAKAGQSASGDLGCCPGLKPSLPSGVCGAGGTPQNNFNGTTGPGQACTNGYVRQNNGRCGPPGAGASKIPAVGLKKPITAKPQPRSLLGRLLSPITGGLKAINNIFNPPPPPPDPPPPPPIEVPIGRHNLGLINPMNIYKAYCAFDAWIGFDLCVPKNPQANVIPVPQFPPGAPPQAPESAMPAANGTACSLNSHCQSGLCFKNVCTWINVVGSTKETRDAADQSCREKNGGSSRALDFGGCSEPTSGAWLNLPPGVNHPSEITDPAAKARFCGDPDRKQCAVYGINGENCFCERRNPAGPPADNPPPQSPARQPAGPVAPPPAGPVVPPPTNTREDINRRISDLDKDCVAKSGPDHYSDMLGFCYAGARPIEQTNAMICEMAGNDRSNFPECSGGSGGGSTPQPPARVTPPQPVTKKVTQPAPVKPKPVERPDTNNGTSPTTNRTENRDPQDEQPMFQEVGFTDIDDRDDDVDTRFDTRMERLRDQRNQCTQDARICDDQLTENTWKMQMNINYFRDKAEEEESDSDNIEPICMEQCTQYPTIRAQACKNTCNGNNACINDCNTTQETANTQCTTVCRGNNVNL